MSAASSSGPVVGADKPEPETRLAASRLAMRTAMLPKVVPSSGTPVSGLRAKLARVPSVEGVLSHPVALLLKDTLQTWWATRPWRPFLAVGSVAAKEMIGPLARQHPARLVGGAMLAGAVLSRWRPWKWALASIGPAIVASMLPTLVSRLATRLPLGALLKVVGVAPVNPPVSRVVPVRDRVGSTSLQARPDVKRN